VTTGYQIKDVAERTGFTPATLRYYEEIGLLPASTRTAAGYRIYDDSSLDRLAFIARAKQLGCSLGEIADLRWRGRAGDAARCRTGSVPSWPTSWPTPRDRSSS